MKVPTLPLQDAVKHLPIIDSINTQSCASKSFMASSSKGGLTKDEAAAIRTYTSACRVYQILNEALRSEQSKNIEPWLSYLKLFHLALNKIHAKKGSYCRGIRGRLNHLYPVGSIVTWVSF